MQNVPAWNACLKCLLALSQDVLPTDLNMTNLTWCHPSRFSRTLVYSFESFHLVVGVQALWVQRPLAALATDLRGTYILLKPMFRTAHLVPRDHPDSRGVILDIFFMLNLFFSQKTHRMIHTKKLFEICLHDHEKKNQRKPTMLNTKRNSLSAPPRYTQVFQVDAVRSVPWMESR